MIGIIKVLDLLSFTSSLPTKCVSLNNELGMVSPTLIDLNPVELDYFALMISLNKCSGSCNAVGDLFTKTCFPNKKTV